MALDIHFHPLRLHADPARVVVRPFNLAWHEQGPLPTRTGRLIGRVIGLDRRAIRSELALVYRDFGNRHWHMRNVFNARFDDVAAQLELDVEAMTAEQRELIGAYLCHEYSYASAAFMNPSVTPHPDQTGMEPGSMRIIMSARCVGEGHISSIAFREAIVTDKRELTLLPNPPFATAASLETGAGVGFAGPVTVYRHEDSTISETVIFPITDAQKNGLEDLRLTYLPDPDGAPCWLGTYTAYSGSGIQSELFRTHDFREFELVPMHGSAARNKGMAMFPKRFGDDYLMIGRQDGENLFLLRSNEVTHWDEGAMLLQPRFPWEFIQIGNCGAPIELDEGWLLLTHGVGAMRKYSIGAVLLDRDDPSKVLGRSRYPLVSAADQDREGYVPNVVYTCGAMKIGSDLFMPYGVADSSIAFAFIPIPSLLAQLT